MNQDNITPETLSQRVDQITTTTDYLCDAVETFRHIDTFRARHLVKLVCAREETNQKLISFYERMYNDLMANKD